jgi:hypothetical protein
MLVYIVKINLFTFASVLQKFVFPQPKYYKDQYILLLIIEFIFNYYLMLLEGFCYVLLKVDVVIFL